MIRTRFAPTPSGYLHAGNGASFVLTWLIARSCGGKILLRIDDLDHARARKEYVEDIFRTLEWLELDYDEGPEGPDDFSKHWSQSLRIPEYEEFLNRLTGIPELLFACTCSRSGLPPGPYPGTCRSKEMDLQSNDVSWRIRIDSRPVVHINDLMSGPVTIDLALETGPFVVKSRNGLPAYQVASLMDDLKFGINFIVRGKDLMTSTACQLFLDSFVPQQPFHHSTFLHHPLLLDPASKKLSKTAGATSLKAARDAGRDPGFVYDWVADWLGADVRGMNFAEMKEVLMVAVKGKLKKL